MEWYQMDVENVARKVGSDPKSGLTPRRVAQRQEEFGPNRLEEAQKVSAWSIFLGQFADFMVLVLVGATVVSLALGEREDAVAILAIVLINAILGFIQEYRAERSLAALKEMTAPVARVIRSGSEQAIPADEVVPGDLVLVEAGDRVPADLRLVEVTALEANESPLTGESLPVKKQVGPLSHDKLPLGDQTNCLFSGCMVTRGHGRGLVIATGMETEFGKIAQLIQDSGSEQTPLQVRLGQLGRWLVAASLLVCGLVVGVGVLRGLGIQTMFMAGVSLAVAAIPEGLPAIVTISLALGVQRMIRRKAIVRKLPAVETLGSVTVICSDKTGTLTENRMKVTRYEGQDSPWAREIAAGCTTVRSQRGAWVGDPTEIALVQWAQTAGVTLDKARPEGGVVGEIPFDSDRKRMSLIRRDGEKMVSMVKGAPDVILIRCTQIRDGEGLRPLGTMERRRIRAQQEEMAGEGLRVLGLAYREMPNHLPKDADWERLGAEENLIWMGLVGMEDPPRKEVRGALRRASLAGIRTIMVTGDHKTTAAAIGKRLGLVGSGERVVTGPELDEMSDTELAKRVRETSIFARVSPRHKLRIVAALKAGGEIVAMTGDGVNDAPAVKEADIGISMGKTGTDVTREASSMVLSDDNYATIVAAVEEGRGIYENIRKFIRYLLACNVGEVLTMFVALLVGLPLPLVPLQILWMNLVTDGLPALALGVDPPEEGSMARPPRPPRESIFSRGLHLKILFQGSVIGLSAVAIFALVLWESGMSAAMVDRARTMAFTTLVMSQLFYVFACRSEQQTVMERGITTNPYLLVAVMVSLGMQLLVLYNPVLSGVFKTVPLPWDDWVLILAFAGWSMVFQALAIRLRRLVRARVGVLRV